MEESDTRIVEEVQRYKHLYNPLSRNYKDSQMPIVPIPVQYSHCCCKQEMPGES